MLKTEPITINGKQYRHNFSDNGFRIRKVGTNEIYDDALDIPENTATYEETEELIPEVEPNE